MITKLPALRPGPSNRRELLCEVQKQFFDSSINTQKSVPALMKSMSP